MAIIYQLPSDLPPPPPTTPNDVHKLHKKYPVPVFTRLGVWQLLNKIKP